MKTLVDLHNQYVSGLITFSEFMIAAFGKIVADENIGQELIALNKMEFADMVRAEREYGLKPVTEYIKAKG